MEVTELVWSSMALSQFSFWIWVMKFVWTVAISTVNWVIPFGSIWAIPFVWIQVIGCDECVGV